MPLDAPAIRKFTADSCRNNLESLQVLAEVNSTNSFLLEQPAPAPGKIRVVATDNQTKGRGRHGKSWHSPPGAGLCISTAYTYASRPEHLSALTLALGLAAAAALDSIGVHGVQLKWPNDIIARDGKLGGILVEVRAATGAAVTVVAGIGVNVKLPKEALAVISTDRIIRPVDLSQERSATVKRERLAGVIVTEMYRSLRGFERAGFAPLRAQWRERDWLKGREVSVNLETRLLRGVVAGIDVDGALLLDAAHGTRCRVTSGSIVSVGPPGAAACIRA